LTDGATFLEATLTPACVEDLNTRYPGKHISSASPNTIIALRRYTIRVTAYGPKRQYITLVLHSVDWLGESRDTHTGAVTHVADCPDVLSSLTKLWETRLEADCRCFLKDTGTEVIMPSSSSRPDEETASQTNTQMPYGTQMVHPYRDRVENSPVMSRAKQTPSLRDGGAPQEGGARLSGLDPKAAKQAELLSLLKLKSHYNTAPSVAPVVPAALSAGGFARTNTPKIRRDMPAPATISRTPLLPGRPDRYLNEPTDASRPISPAHLADYRDTRALNIEMDIEPQRMSGRASAAPASGELSEEDLDDEEPAWLQDCRPTCGCATVPTKQRTLLSKPESWHKPEAGLRFPEANIPIDILRELREHARMNAVEAPSSPVSDDDDELPDAHVENDVLDGENADTDANEEDSASHISWSSSPAPEPPARPGLPPDSSFDDGRRTNTHDVPSAQADSLRRPEPVVIESSNETTDLPSSPPAIQHNNDSDEEMELEVPRGLGDSPTNNMPTSEPEFVGSASVIQVEQTPYAKGKRPATVPPPGQQTSSGESKDTTSTSVISCTYKDQIILGKRDAVEIVVGGPGPVIADSTRKTSGNGSDAVCENVMELLSLASTSKHVRVPSAGEGDVHMEEASQEIRQARKTALAPHQALGMYPLDQNNTAAFPEPSPISAQRPTIDLSSSGEKMPEILPPNSSEPPKTPAIVAEIAQMKRKLDVSPSKKSARLSKRREIKIVGFGGDSPPRDTAAEFRQARHESLSRFREERRSTTIDANQTSSETREDVRARDHPSSSAVHQRDIYPLAMDIDDPFDENDTQSLVHNHQSARFGPSLGSAPASHTLSTTRKEQMDYDLKTTSIQRARPETIFQIFKAAYPDYTGSTQHFIGQCKQMHKLDLEDKMVPKWQWDDFIIRNRTDYKDYILQCSEEGEDPEPYYRFYKDNIRDTLYAKGVIKNRKTLSTALEELETRPSTAATAVVTAPVGPRVPIAPVPSLGAVTARKSSRRSLPWGPSQSIESSRDRVDSSPAIRSRHFLPTAPQKNQLAPHADSPLRRALLHTSSARTSSLQPTHSPSSRSGTTTPLARTSSDSLAANRSLDLTKIPTEPTGDTYRDFVFAWQRSTSLTGSTEVSSFSWTAIAD
jgi:hypothetical protein